MPKIDTEVVTVDAIHPEIAKIERAAALIRAGEVVVFPTETVYGLGADALQPGAVERIFAAKGRPFSDPLIVHIADEGTLDELASEIPAQVHQLARAFWPGPLTLILPRRPLVPALVTAGLQTVAVRMPRHPVALALIRAAGTPIAAPSANRFMHVSPTTAQHALADLQGRVPLILDSGPCEVGVESTVLDLCAMVPTILRPGGVSLEELRAVLPDVRLPLPANKERRDNDTSLEAQRSPGQLLTHYAPAVPLLLFEGTAEVMRATMLTEVQRRRENGERIGVLVADEDVAAFQDSGAQVYTLGNAAAPEKVAAALFAGLRTLETSGVKVILCRSFDEHGLGLAIRDRLLRAAAGNVFKQS
ncbi:MAG TPA: threonylcarbamoyl-AMP synthase [Ktedonobacter sp.]|nr:threonylcarbamoyl-AMP synthase [Ktedonobacter sp.]